MDKGINNLAVRKSNKKNILKLLYRGKGLTKQEVALQLGLSLPTVSQIMKELETEGLIREIGQQKSSGGRRPAVNSIVAGSRHSLGIGITKHHVRFALLDLGLAVVDKERHRVVFEDSPAYWKDVQAKAREFLRRNAVAERTMLGIGLSLPGVVLSGSKVMNFAPTLDSGPIDLEKLETYFGPSLLVANDATLAGMAEVWFKDDSSTEIYLLLNKGVGGSILMKNNPQSFGERAGEFGHMTIMENGKLCSCGQKGCFEACCSSSVITDESGVTLDEFFDALRSGNTQYRKIWNRYMKHLAMGINNLRNIFDTDVIVGGEMSKYVGEYEKELRRELARRSSFNDDGSYLKISNYGEFDAAIGAALLHVESFLENQ